MKFDIVRAWKDEVYRQSLNKKQRNKLPVNPAGELTEAEMERVVGGDGGGGGAGGIQPAAPITYHHTSYRRHTSVATASSASSASHMHSHSVLCDINVFSLSIPALALPHLLDILSGEKQVCANVD
ncbi:MAG TPA: mersacidin/lichenicidin family type 2 lantibiotic [Ktedonobacteraceae bacterium]